MSGALTKCLRMTLKIIKPCLRSKSKFKGNDETTSLIRINDLFKDLNNHAKTLLKTWEIAMTSSHIHNL